MPLALIPWPFLCAVIVNSPFSSPFAARVPCATAFLLAGEDAAALAAGTLLALFAQSKHCWGRASCCLTSAVQSPSQQGEAGCRRLCSLCTSPHAEPQLYQEIRERGLNSVSHESDEDLLEEPNPEEPSLTGAAIVVRSYRPTQVTWSQLPEVHVPTSCFPMSFAWSERARLYLAVVNDYSFAHPSLQVGPYGTSRCLAH